MEFLHALKSRRSVRSYAPEPVPQDIIEDILHLAATAPSACNIQGWRCILLQSREDLEWIYRRGGSSTLRTSAQALLVCYASQTENCEWDDNIQSAAAFIAYFQLIAHERGIGSCWICHLPPKIEMSRRFCIPADYTPIAIVTFGYYATDFSPQVRSAAPAANLLSIDRWHLAADESNMMSVSPFRKSLRKIYYLLPFRGWLRGLAGRYEKKFNDK